MAAKHEPEFVYSVNQFNVVNRLRFPRIIKHLRDQGLECDAVVDIIIQLGTIKGCDEIEELVKRGYLHLGIVLCLSSLI